MILCAARCYSKYSHPTRKNIVIGGNMRLQVLQDLKYAEVPVVELHLTERKERELNLRLIFSRSFFPVG